MEDSPTIPGEVTSTGVQTAAGPPTGAPAEDPARIQVVPDPPSREALLAATLRSIGDAVITADLEGRVTFLNPVAEHLTGWPLADAVGRPAEEVFSIFNGTTRRPAPCPIRRVLAEGRVVGLANHTSLRARNGTEHVIDDSGAPIYDDAGKLVGVVLVFRDITEKRRREEELSHLNRTLRALSRSNRAAIEAVDEAGYLGEVCRAIVEDCGYAMVWIGMAEDDAARTVRPVASAGLEQGYLEALQLTWADTERGRGPTGTAIRTGRPCGCADMRTDPRFAPWRDEAVRRGYASSMVIPLVGPERTLGAVNLHAREPGAFPDTEVDLLTNLAADVVSGIVALRIRAALRISEEKFAKAFASSPAGITITRLADGVVIDANDAWLSMFGYRREEVIGRPTVGLGAWSSPEARERCVQELRSRGSVRGWEETGLSKSGRPVATLGSAEVLDIAGERMVVSTWLDITDRKMAEEELRFQAELISRVRDPIVSTDPDQRILSWNRAAETAYGWTEEEVVGRIVDELFAPENVGITREQAESELAGAGSTQIESIHSTRDGRRISVESSLSLMKDSDGTTAGTLAVHRDITDRKRAEGALRESEAKYRNLFENMTEEVHFWRVVRDESGAISTWRLVDANAPTLATWGRSSVEEIRGKTTDEIFGPGAMEHYLPVVQKIMSEGVPYTYEDYFPNLDKYFRFTSVPYGEFFITTGADITAIRKAHDVLEQQVQERTAELKAAHEAVDCERRRFRDALDQLPAYVILLSPDYQVPFANRFFEERFGRSDGRRCYEYLFQRSAPCEICETYRVLDTSSPHRWEWTGPDGRDYDIYDFPFTDVDGSPLIMEVGLDITERKRGESELVRHREHLEEIVEERTAEVEALNARLQRAMAETHHRVKNNLQTIAALIDMQRMTDRENVPVSELERLSRHIRGLASIHDLLTQESRANGDAEFVSVPHALEKLKPLLDSMVGGRELRFEVGELRLPIRQTTGLAVVVNELVSNAAKHGQGPIELTVDVAEQDATLAVRDHGPGFPAGFQASAPATTGLDLVQSVGGWDLRGNVEFSNAPDGGARVIVRFPIEREK